MIAPPPSPATTAPTFGVLQGLATSRFVPDAGNVISMEFFDAVGSLGIGRSRSCWLALIAFGFEVINGFHHTANAVATVIHTNWRSPPRRRLVGALIFTASTPAASVWPSSRTLCPRTCREHQTGRGLATSRFPAPVPRIICNFATGIAGCRH